MSYKTSIQSLFNYFGFEIRRTRSGIHKSKRTNRLSFHETATGNYYLPTDAKGDRIALDIYGNRIFDEPIYQTARQFIKTGTIALDIGSNFGQMAVLMSKLVTETGIVYAFEADDFVYEILKKNATANGKNIIPIHKAVHSVGKEILYFPLQDFEKYQDYGAYGIDYKNGRGRPIETIAIDDMEFNLPISFMKIDIQGGDLFALKGAKKTIAKHKMPIIFEYEYLFEKDLDLCFQEYIDVVLDMDYYFASVVNGHNFLILPQK